MEKIKKLKYTGDLIEKINEIIDRLNEQPSYRDWCIQKAKEGRFKGMPIPEPQDTPEEYVDLHNPVTGTTYKVRKKSEDAGRIPTIGDMEIVKEVNEILEDTPEEYRSPEVLGAIARGYTTERNANKMLDPDLCEDIGIEVQQLLEEREDRAREEGKREQRDLDRQFLKDEIDLLWKQII